ncbi:MAG: PRC-barrel domain-containing protein [Pseudomonadota bacterium]
MMLHPYVRVPVAVLALSALPALAQQTVVEESITEESTAPAEAPAAAPAAPATGGYGAFGDVAVASLLGQNVIEGSGANVGEIERLVSADGSVMAVVGVGGFLGFGEHDVAVPLAEMAPVEGGVQLQTLVRTDLEAMDAWAGEGEELPRNITVSGTPLNPENGTPVSE